MNIILIMPAVGRKNNQPYVNSWKMEPLALGVLAALTPKGVRLSFYDDRLEGIPYDRPADLVAINVETYTARRAYQIAQRFRERGVPVVLGGYHPTLMPDEAGLYADSVLVGEAEGVWGRICRDAAGGELKKIYRASPQTSLNGVLPDRSIFRDKKYLPLTLVESARGCRYACQFCSVTSFYQQTYRPRPISAIIQDIKRSKKNFVFFVDDNIVCDFERAKMLFRALQPLKIRWISQGSIDMAADPEMLTLMKTSGCRGVLIGFESLNKANLAQMGKQWNVQHRSYEEALKRFRDNGLVVYGTFVFGYDQDTRETIQQTLQFAVQQKLFLAAFNHLVPFPGTPLYRRYREEKRLLSGAWWLDPDYKFGDVAFQPKQMSPAELSQSCLDARRQFYGTRSVLQRVDFKSNCRGIDMFFNYLFYNHFSGKESVKRQGLPLGQGLDREEQG